MSDYGKLTINEMVDKLGSIMGCLENIEANKKDNITKHYDCSTDLLEVQRSLKALKGYKS